MEEYLKDMEKKGILPRKGKEKKRGQMFG